MKCPDPKKVFRLNGKDLTFFKIEEGRVMFYMRYEAMWQYPPTDGMERKFWRNLDKNGFYYVEDEFRAEIDRLEQWYRGQVKK